MKRSQKSTTGRRDFLKLLGLGGLGAAAGLTVGSKALGGTVVKPSPLDKPSGVLPDLTPEAWARDGLKVALDHLPVPPAGKIVTKTHKEGFDALKESVDRGFVKGLAVMLPHSLCAEFITRDGVVAVLSLVGAIRLAEECDITSAYVRGQFEELTPGAAYYTFDIEGRVNYFNGKIEPAQLSTLLEFDLKVTAGDKVYMLHDCMWTDLEQDCVLGLFNMRGIAMTGEAIDEA